MAGVPDSWVQELLPVSDRSVERATLTGPTAPVQLIFPSLPDGGDLDHAGALGHLLDGTYPDIPTIVPEEGPVVDSFSYTRAALIDVPTALMDLCQPTIIRAHDPQPDPLARAEHPDHVSAAQFVALAATGSHGPGVNHHVTLVNYHCHSIEDSQPSLSAQPAAEKAATFAVYQEDDPLAADLGLTTAICYRWPPGNAWMGRDPSGRSWAFAVQDSQVMAWHQDSESQPWTGPEEMGGGPLAPCVSVGNNADGTLQVFGLSLDTHDITTAYQADPDLAFSPWTTLGNPGGIGASAIGAPTIAVNLDGRLEVFARNVGDGLSTTFQTSPNGTFSEWLELPNASALIDDGASAVQTEDGPLVASRLRPVNRRRSLTDPGIAWNELACAVIGLPSGLVQTDGSLTLFAIGVDGWLETYLGWVRLGS